jgi:ketosteroid isomerase-like protein
VLRGTLLRGIADSSSRPVVREYTAGDFIPIPAGRLHVEGASDEAEVYVTGIGPVQTVVRDSASPDACQPAAPTRSGAVADSVRALVADYDRAWSAHDTATVSRLLSSEYQYFSSKGDVDSKSDAIRVLASPRYVLRRADRSEISVKVSGPTAIVSSRWQGAGTWEGKPFTDDQRCGQVWTRSATGWQVLSEHCVQISPS